MRFRHATVILWALWSPYVAGGLATAQQPAQNRPAGVAAVPPAAGTPSAQGIPGSAPADDLGATLETNPAVRAALELPRRQPSDFFQAIGWLIDLGRPELAKPILAELMKQPLTDAQRAALVNQFGSGSMLRLARTSELQPEGAQFANACMAAAAAAASDPQRIARLLAELTDPAFELRAQARQDLAASGIAGVVATLEAFAREPNAERRAALAFAVEEMRPLAVGPLLAMLTTSDARLREEVAALLVRLGATQALPFLPAEPSTAERALRTAISRYSAGMQPFAADADNRVELWHWDDQTKQLSAARYPADEARIIWLSRLARALAALRPENRDYQRQAWLLGLEAAGLIRSTENLLSGVDGTLVNDVLADALKAGYPHAAAAAADELGRRHDVVVLQTADGQPAPLTNALADPDRRVRFAALRAIIALDPTLPFPGSSGVPEALSWFAGGSGERRAVVAMPTTLMASDVAGMLAGYGLEADITTRGRQAVDRARESADVEMILVDMDIASPDIRQVLYELRTWPETASTPVALLAGEGRLEAAERLASEHTRVFAVPRPHSREVVARTIEDLHRLAGRDAAPPDQRAAQAMQAVSWLAKLLASDRPFYDLHRAAPALYDALHSPDAAQPAITALSRLGTPNSQQALVDFASERTLPVRARAQAAEAFRASVAKHGLLLTSQEILTQYDRYNASRPNARPNSMTDARVDTETEQILGGLLDTIESRRSAVRPAPPAGL